MYIKGKIEWDAKPPDVKGRWLRVLPYWNRYQRHMTGISYAMQGFVLDDGVSIRADVIHTHATINQFIEDVKKTKAFRDAQAMRRKQQQIPVKPSRRRRR